MTLSTLSTESHEVHDRKESSHVTDDGAGFSLTSSLSTPHAASWTLPPTRAPSHSHTSPRGTRLRSDAMDTPRLASSFSTPWPTPGNALTGKGSTTRAACDAGSTVWSSGLCRPEMSLASVLLCATPADIRSPDSARTASLASAATTAPTLNRLSCTGSSSTTSASTVDTRTSPRTARMSCGLCLLLDSTRDVQECL